MRFSKLIKISLPAQILISMALGLFAGFFLGPLAAPLEPIGSAFIMLLKMSVLPYITCSLIRGIGGLRRRQGWALVREGGFFLILIWGIVLTTLFVLTLTFPDQDTSYYHQPSAESQTDINSMLALFIPSNPFYALANNIVPAVVLFSIFFGVALMPLKEKKEPVLSILDICIAGLTRITRWIVRLSPIGIFALIASATGTMTVAEFDKLQIYLYGFIAATALFTFLFLPMLITACTRLKYRDLLRVLQPGLLLAFATGNIFVSLPYLIEGVQQLCRRPGIDKKDSDNMVRTITPIAYNLPLVGNLMALFFILFLSFFYAMPLTLGNDIKLIVMGLFTFAGPVSAAINSISFLIDALHLPSDGVSLFAETMALTRNLQGLAGAMGIAVFTLLTTFAHNKRLHFKPFAIARNSAIALTALVAAVFAVRAAQIKQPQPQPVFMQLTIDSPVPAKVYTYTPDDLPPRSALLDSKKTLFKQIQEERVLRVGYSPTPLPFAYFNQNGELVGYDIAFAYDLAQTLNAELVFIPFALGELEEMLKNHEIDIAMSALTVTTNRLKQITFSDPYLVSTMVFVVPDYKRDSFADLEQVRQMRELRLGVLKGSTFEKAAEIALPNATIVPLDNYETALPDEEVDAYLWGEQEGMTWSLIHPSFTAVKPTPMMGKEYLAWALPPDAIKLREYVNYWTAIRKLEGITDKEYKKWVLGDDSETKPRWSIIRNVLHWVGTPDDDSTKLERKPASQTILSQPT